MEWIHGMDLVEDKFGRRRAHSHMERPRRMASTMVLDAVVQDDTLTLARRAGSAASGGRCRWRKPDGGGIVGVAAVIAPDG